MSQDKSSGQTGIDPKAKKADDPTAPVISTPALCSVVIDGRTIKFDITRIELEQFVDDHHRLRLVIRETGQFQTAQEFSSAIPYASFLGKAISLAIKPQGGVVDAAKELGFVGLVTQVALANSINGLNVGSITAASPTIALDGAGHNAFHHDKTASDIIGLIVRKYPLTIGSIDSTSGMIKFSVQYRETDYAYVMRLASEYGLFAVYDGKEFRAVKAGSSKNVELVWRESLGSFSLGLGTAASEFMSDVYNYEQKSTYSQDTKSVPPQAALSQLSKTSPDASKAIYSDSGFAALPKVIADAQSLDHALARAKSQAMGRMIICTGQSIIPTVAVGGCVKIKGMGQIDGMYWVLTVRHLFDESGKYHNDFTCTPVDVAFPQPRAVRPPITGLQPAVVVDNYDPDKMGRVKVKFPWLSADETSWVRYVATHAGKDRGWFVLPEIGDEVMVGFEQGCPDLPVAFGSVYNKDDAPHSSTNDPKNSIKMMLTRGGNKILLDDTDGKEKLTLVTKDGSHLTIDPVKPTITLETKGDVAISGDKITIKGSSITLDAQGDVKIKAAGNLNAEGSANTTIKGGVKTAIEGIMVEVKGTPIKLN